MSQCQGVVVELCGADAVIELPERAVGCGNCSKVGGCQTGLTGFHGKSRRFRVPNAGARVGDQVGLTVAKGAVWRAARVAYMVPLLLALGGAALGQFLADTDIVAAIGMLVGLGVGLIALRRDELTIRQGQGIFTLQLVIKT